MAELEDAGGLNPPSPRGECGFKSRPGHTQLAGKMHRNRTMNGVGKLAVVHEKSQNYDRSVRKGSVYRRRSFTLVGGFGLAMGALSPTSLQVDSARCPSVGGRRDRTGVGEDPPGCFVIRANRGEREVSGAALGDVDQVESSLFAGVEVGHRLR